MILVDCSPNQFNILQYFLFSGDPSSVENLQPSDSFNRGVNVTPVIEKPVEKAPESFQPIHVSEQTEAPRPAPSMAQVKAFESKNIFKSIDDHAMQVIYYSLSAVFNLFVHSLSNITSAQKSLTK